MSGRIRSLKPEWLDDELALKSCEARVLSVGLVLLSDDHGRGRAHPDHLQSRVFPGKPSVVLANALEDLASLRYMLLYEVEGQKYFAIRNWTKHQRVDHPAAPKCPAHDSENAHIYADLSEFARDSENLARAFEVLAKLRESPRALRARDPLPSSLTKLLPDPDLPDRSGSREAKSGGGSKGKRKPATTALPEPFPLTEKHLEYAASKGWPEWWLRNRHENFCDLAVAKGWRYIDWDRAFFSYLRGEIGYQRGPEDLAHLAPHGVVAGENRDLFRGAGPRVTAKPWRPPPGPPPDPNPPPALPPPAPLPRRLANGGNDG